MVKISLLVILGTSNDHTLPVPIVVLLVVFLHQVRLFDLVNPLTPSTGKTEHQNYNGSIFYQDMIFVLIFLRELSNKVLVLLGVFVLNLHDGLQGSQVLHDCAERGLGNFFMRIGISPAF